MRLDEQIPWKISHFLDGGLTSSERVKKSFPAIALLCIETQYALDVFVAAIFDCDDEIIGCQTSGVRLSITRFHTDGILVLSPPFNVAMTTKSFALYSAFLNRKKRNDVYIKRIRKRENVCTHMRLGSADSSAETSPPVASCSEWTAN